MPIFEKYGFFPSVMGPKEYVFSNYDNTRAIFFDRDKFPPRKLRVCYSVKGETSFMLQLSNFKPGFLKMGLEYYSSEQELETFLNDMAHSTVEVVLPYLDAMEENYVFDTFEMSMALSKDTETRITRFADKWGLTKEPTRENLVSLDEILDSMKTTVHNRKEDFEKHESQIIDLSAYFGELIAKDGGKSGQWLWREISEGLERYVIEAMGYDPLSRVVHAWNFGTEVTNYSLGGFPLRM